MTAAQASFFDAGDIGTLAAPETDPIERRLTAAISDKLLSDKQREALRIVSMHRGAKNPIRGVDLALQLGMDESEDSRRTVKKFVEDFVTRLKIPIGASRFKPAGYFLIVSLEDRDLALGPLRSEVTALLRRMRALSSQETVGALVRQMVLQMEMEKR